MSLLVLLLALGFTFGMMSAQPARGSGVAGGSITASMKYIGAERCGQCHQDQLNHWKSSHHSKAMMHASSDTVLGNFRNTEFSYYGVRTRFFKKSDKFFVTTDGPDGKLTDYEVRYTFGVEPLQQYLVALPGGRLHALPVAWDNRRTEEGGQRWYHLYPDERIDATNPLHWTKRFQNWNNMCAECHTTNFQKNYSAEKNAYDSQFDALGVGCEACHGPGQRHEEWAMNPVAQRDETGSKGLVVQFDERAGVTWSTISGKPSRSIMRSSSKEIDTCARCHSRRSQLSSDFVPGAPLTQTHAPQLLNEALYHPDGKIKDEVFEYGSFLQSKMFQQGVTCSDCHEPHSANLRVAGNGLCLQCHAVATYEAPTHHFHKAGSEGTSCVGCHMPGKNYMGVDYRHDHSFKLPRIAESRVTEAPGMCVGCHLNKSADWIITKAKQWYGQKIVEMPAYAQAFAAAHARNGDAEARLLGVLADKAMPPIVRATAAQELGNVLTQDSFPSLVDALGDPSELVRMGALTAIETLPPQDRWALTRALLNDPSRAIRVRVAGMSGDVPAEQMTPQESSAFAIAYDDFMAEARLNADTPESNINLGNFYLSAGNTALAESSYRKALALDPLWVPSYLALTNILQLTERDNEIETVIRQGLQKTGESADLYFNLGMLRVRQSDKAGALEYLQKATSLAPENAYFSYVYAIALDEQGKWEEAIRVVEAALAKSPHEQNLAELRELLQRQRASAR